MTDILSCQPSYLAVPAQYNINIIQQVRALHSIFLFPLFSLKRSRQSKGQTKARSGSPPFRSGSFSCRARTGPTASPGGRSGNSFRVTQRRSHHQWLASIFCYTSYIVQHQTFKGWHLTLLPLSQFKHYTRLSLEDGLFHPVHHGPFRVVGVIVHDRAVRAARHRRCRV